jgi:hypothetical protein
VVPRNNQQGRPEAAEELGRRLVLFPQAAVGEVAARDHELGVDALDQLANRELDFRLSGATTRPEMQVGNLKDAY